MLLRIEDTDRERSTEAAIAAILDGLKWLELDWDGEVIYQFNRAARHREVAETLLASGKAYRCYATPEELTAMREKARAEGRTRLYDGLWRDRDPSEAPAGHEAHDPAPGAPDRRDRDRGPGSGPRGLAERKPRRPRAAARRRQSDLHARRRGRRPRHGRHAHHSRRRSPDQRRAPEADLRCARLGHPQHVPYSPDPWPRRLETVQAPWRAGRGCLSRDGIFAGGAAQLPGQARMEPRRPGDIFDRGNDRRVRPVRHRPLGRALRFRQAGKPQRPLHPSLRRSIPREHVRGGT